MLRRDNLRLIERATPEDLKRVGVHAERGEESAGYLVRLYAGHDLMHLRQIDRIERLHRSLLLDADVVVPRLHVGIDPLQLVQHAVDVVPVAADAVRLAAHTGSSSPARPGAAARRTSARLLRTARADPSRR